MQVTIKGKIFFRPGVGGPWRLEDQEEHARVEAVATLCRGLGLKRVRIDDYQEAWEQEFAEQADQRPEIKGGETFLIR